MIGADQERLPGLAETVRLPLPAARHDGVHRGDGQLAASTPIRRPPAKIGAAMKAFGSPWDGMYRSKSTNVTALESAPSRAARKARPKIRVAIRRGEQARAEVALSLHAEHDAAGAVVDQVEVGIAEPSGEAMERPLQEALGFLVGGRVGAAARRSPSYSRAGRRGIGDDVEHLEHDGGRIGGRHPRFEERRIATTSGRCEARCARWCATTRSRQSSISPVGQAPRLGLEIVPGARERLHGLAHEAGLGERGHLETEPGEVRLDGPAPVLANAGELIDGVRFQRAAGTPVALAARHGHGQHTDAQQGEHELGAQRESAQHDRHPLG